MSSYRQKVLLDKSEFLCYKCITLVRDKMSNQEILEFRKRFKLSREDVASKLGVSAPTIWRWENNKCSPHKVLYNKLTKIMKGYINQARESISKKR